MSDLLRNLDKPITPEIALYGMMFVGLMFAAFALLVVWSERAEEKKNSQKSR
jgi:hypothetical protein